MALIHNALRPGKVRSRPSLVREAAHEISVEFRRWDGIFPGSGVSRRGCHLPIGVLPGMSVMLDLAAFEGIEAGKPAESGKRSCARVAERQTRWLQVPVSERVWGFKSPLAHAIERAPVLGPGLFCFPGDPNWVTDNVLLALRRSSCCYLVG